MHGVLVGIEALTAGGWLYGSSSRRVAAPCGRRRADDLDGAVRLMAVEDEGAAGAELVLVGADGGGVGAGAAAVGEVRAGAPDEGEVSFGLSGNWCDGHAPATTCLASEAMHSTVRRA